MVHIAVMPNDLYQKCQVYWPSEMKVEDLHTQTPSGLSTSLIPFKRIAFYAFTKTRTITKTFLNEYMYISR